MEPYALTPLGGGGSPPGPLDGPLERSPYTPDAAALDVFSPVSILMDNLRLDVPDKQHGARARVAAATTACFSSAAREAASGLCGACSLTRSPGTAAAAEDEDMTGSPSTPAGCDALGLRSACDVRLLGFAHLKCVRSARSRFADTPGFVDARPCPPTPHRTRHGLNRQDSLKDTKLLVATTSVRLQGRPFELGSCLTRARPRAPTAAPRQPDVVHGPGGWRAAARAWRGGPLCGGRHAHARLAPQWRCSRARRLA